MPKDVDTPTQKHLSKISEPGAGQLTILTCIARLQERPSTLFVEDHNHHHLRVALHSVRGDRV